MRCFDTSRRTVTRPASSTPCPEASRPRCSTGCLWLSSSSRSVLDAFAVAEQVDARILVAVTGLSEGEVSRGLRDGLDSTLLVRVEDAPSGVGWRHRLIR